MFSGRGVLGLGHGRRSELNVLVLVWEALKRCDECRANLQAPDINRRHGGLARCTTEAGPARVGTAPAWRHSDGHDGRPTASANPRRAQALTLLCSSQHELPFDEREQRQHTALAWCKLPSTSAATNLSFFFLPAVESFFVVVLREKVM